MLRPKYMWFQYLVMFMFTLYFEWMAYILGFFAPFIILADFMRSLGKKIPIRELILATLSVQCLLVPFLYYSGVFAQSLIHPMAVPSKVYFSYLSPAILLMAVGISIFKEEYYDFKIQNPKKYFAVGKALIITGLISDIVIFQVPGNIAFFVKLLTYLKFIGAYYILFSEQKYYQFWIVLSLINSLALSIYTTVFQEFLGWSLFFVLYFLYHKKLSKVLRFSIIGVLLLGVFILQDVKIKYRKALRETEGEVAFDSAVSMFADIYVTSSADDETFSDESYTNNLVRFNQGYIISRILYYVPKNEPFAKGESIEDALYSAIVPRFLDPDKAIVGGGNGLYSRFTGYVLVGGTSMDLSVFGETYANYGRLGGILACLLLGLFYNLVISAIFKYSKHSPQLVFWIPYLCLIMVRPENAFTPIMNHLFKAALVLFLIYHVYLKFQPLKARFRFISSYN